MLAAYLHWTTLSKNGGGFEYLAETLHTSESLLPWYLKLALFRRELLTCGLVIPGILLLTTKTLGRRVGPVSTLALGLVVQIVLFIELKVFWEVGSFLPFSVLVAGITDAGRRYADEYVQWASFIKLGVLVGGAVVLHLVIRWRRAREKLSGIWSILCVACWGTIVGVTASSWLIVLPPTPYEGSSLTDALAAWGDFSRSTAVRAPIRLEVDDLLAEYRALSNAPVPNGTTAYTGAAKGDDVIVMILETAPSTCLDMSRPDSLPPTMRQLARRSFLGLAHYSTYPFTERALFSIWTSWYPPNHPRSYIQELAHTYPRLLAPGMARSAKNAGYATAVFQPDRVENWHKDQVGLPAFGFDRWATSVDEHPEQRPDWGSLTRREKAYANDQIVLNLMKEQIQAEVKEHRHYLFSFAPQYTHGPWPGLTAASSTDETTAICGPIFNVVDGWLRELVELLKEQGTLDRTVIVIVGDHGLRTRQEHPQFVAGTLGDISFRVPLMIYAPGVLDSAVTIPWVTSHIDISPSVSDLLGFGTERQLEQGSPIWTPAIQERRTYFLARNYLGADGYFFMNTICMHKYAIHSSTCTPWEGSLSFSPKNLRGNQETAGDSVYTRIAQLTTLMDTWSRALIPNNFLRLMPPSAGE